MKKIMRVLCAAVAMMIAFSCIPAMAANDWSNGWGSYGQGGWGGSYGKTTSSKVVFYIEINGKQLDSNGNISGRDSKSFTDPIGTSNLKKNLPSSYSIALGNGVTEADVLENVSSVPSDKKVFDSVVKQYKEQDAYIRSSNGKVIPWSRLNSDYYKVSWYVLKYENDGWHVDGIIIEKETNEEISIVIPKEDADRATCVEYDVRKGTFAPGTMEVKANRPHSHWRGDNDTLVMDGFEDVWYTVLDEKTFEANTNVVPQKLMDAAMAVAKLAGARLSELDSKLQKQYGRIDSQAYKQEYIARNGKTTLYVTPYITERLSSRYGVNNDELIWLAEGDSQGNIVKVYVMDRQNASISNMFDGE